MTISVSMKGNSNKRIQHKKQASEREGIMMIMKKPVFSEYLSEFFNILHHLSDGERERC